jgi:hypothetical protein
LERERKEAQAANAAGQETSRYREVPKGKEEALCIGSPAKLQDGEIARSRDSHRVDS